MFEARHGKTIVLVLGIVVCGVLAAAIFSRDRLAEEWHIRRLRSADVETRNEAADALRARRTERAIPHLIRDLFEELTPPDEAEVRVRSRFAAALLAMYSTDPENELPVKDAVVSRARAEYARREGWPAIERLIRIAAQSPRYPFPIDATVTAVSKADGLVFLSAGGDQGVKVGYVFTVFRGDSFIGKVRVVRISPDLSGSEVVFEKEGAEIQRGDQASTAIGGL